MDLFVVLYVVWLIGIAAVGPGYYATYRAVYPSFWRVVAAIFWPIGIPLDYFLVARPEQQRRKRG